MNMYKIILKDGSFINIKATKVECRENSKIIKLINDRAEVARINMDNIVGYVHADYNVKSEE